MLDKQGSKQGEAGEPAEAAKQTPETEPVGGDDSGPLRRISQMMQDRDIWFTFESDACREVQVSELDGHDILKDGAADTNPTSHAQTTHKDIGCCGECLVARFGCRMRGDKQCVQGQTMTDTDEHADRDPGGGFCFVVEDDRQPC